jgi:hypothetical protein
VLADVRGDTQRLQWAVLVHLIENVVTIVQHRLRGDDPEVNQYLEMAKRNTDRATDTASDWRSVLEAL